MRGFFFFILLISILFSKISVAQRETNIWYFGNHCGLDFNSGIPEPINGGQINSWEGCASISDSLGNLLFYSDGTKIWNSQHQIMSNGSELLGDTSSTQSALIVHHPGYKNLYYVFTVDNQAYSDGFCYSIVDMNLNNGLGDVNSEKNIQIMTPSTEKLTAVKQANGKDYWIMTHGWCNNKFYAWGLTETGLNLTPVISEVGTIHDLIDPTGVNLNSIGYMHISPNAEKLACAIFYTSIVEVFDFDNVTGHVSNPITIPFDPISGTYGVEFSRDCSKIYISSNVDIFQVDLTAGTPEEIINSKFKIYTAITFPGAMQLATNGKIYVALDREDSLSVINNPEIQGLACNFEKNAVYLNGGMVRRGLPGFMASYLVPPNILVTGICAGETFTFQADSYLGVDSVHWIFGDPQSGTLNTSNDLISTHLYQYSGNYKVEMILWRNGVPFKIFKYLYVSALPDIFLGNDTVLCQNANLFIDVLNFNWTYVWNNGTTLPNITINLPGKYWVDVQNKYTGCRNSDSIKILYENPPQIFIGNDTSFCKNSQFTLNAFHQNYSYLWSTGETTSSIIVRDTGIYSIEITDYFKCKNTDFIKLLNYPLPQFSLGNDTSICLGTTKLLNSPFNNVSNTWQDLSHEKECLVITDGIFWLEVVDDKTCIFRDSILITYTNKPVFDLGKDTLLCEGIYYRIDPKVENVDYLWHNNSTAPFFMSTDSILCFVKITNKCGSNSDTIKIYREYCGEIDIPNVITPNNDGVNDIFFIKGIDKDQWEFYVYSRWGNLLFFDENYKNNWNADKILSGVYYYLLKKHESELIYKGFFHVLK